MAERARVYATVRLGEGLEVHALDPVRRGKTLCGLGTMWASRLESVEGPPTCSICLRAIGGEGPAA